MHASNRLWVANHCMFKVSQHSNCCVILLLWWDPMKREMMLNMLWQTFEATGNNCVCINNFFHSFSTRCLLFNFEKAHGFHLGPGVKKRNETVFFQKRNEKYLWKQETKRNETIFKETKLKRKNNSVSRKYRRNILFWKF
jgi:hypothetical protein